MILLVFLIGAAALVRAEMPNQFAKGFNKHWPACMDDQEMVRELQSADAARQLLLVEVPNTPAQLLWTSDAAGDDQITLKRALVLDSADGSARDVTLTFRGWEKDARTVMRTQQSYFVWARPERGDAARFEVDLCAAYVIPACVNSRVACGDDPLFKEGGSLEFHAPAVTPAEFEAFAPALRVRLDALREHGALVARAKLEDVCARECTNVQRCFIDRCVCRNGATGGDGDQCRPNGADWHREKFEDVAPYVISNVVPGSKPNDIWPSGARLPISFDVSGFERSEEDKVDVYLVNLNQHKGCAGGSGSEEETTFLGSALKSTFGFFESFTRASKVRDSDADVYLAEKRALKVGTVDLDEEAAKYNAGDGKDFTVTLEFTLRDHSCNEQGHNWVVVLDAGFYVFVGDTFSVARSGCLGGVKNQNGDVVSQRPGVCTELQSCVGSEYRALEPVHGCGRTARDSSVQALTCCTMNNVQGSYRPQLVTFSVPPVAYVGAPFVATWEYASTTLQESASAKGLRGQCDSELVSEVSAGDKMRFEMAIFDATTNRLVVSLPIESEEKTLIDSEPWVQAKIPASDEVSRVVSEYRERFADFFEDKRVKFGDDRFVSPPRAPRQTSPLIGVVRGFLTGDEFKVRGQSVCWFESNPFEIKELPCQTKATDEEVFFGTCSASKCLKGEVRDTGRCEGFADGMECCYIERDNNENFRGNGDKPQLTSGAEQLAASLLALAPALLL